MEENVFPEINHLLDQYVICKLYVDERTKLISPEIAPPPYSVDAEPFTYSTCRKSNGGICNISKKIHV